MSTGRWIPRLVACWMVLIVGPLPSGAASEDGETLLNRLGQRLRTIEVARFDFREHKHLTALDRSLELEGTMVFSRDLGLYRHVTSPSGQEQLIAADGTLIRRRADGILQRRRLGNTPAGRYFRGLYGLFAGSFDDLRSLGTLAPKGDLTRWSLRITPEEGRGTARLPTFVLEGGDSLVHRLTTIQNGGDSSVVELSPIDVNKPLPPDTRRRIRALLDGE